MEWDSSALCVPANYERGEKSGRDAAASCGNLGPRVLKAAGWRPEPRGAACPRPGRRAFRKPRDCPFINYPNIAFLQYVSSSWDRRRVRKCSNN